MATKQNLFNEAEKKSKLAKIGKDKGFINPNSKTSIVSKSDGSTTINSGIYAQIKCDKASGVITDISLQSITNTVQKELTTSDLIINRHKFNTQLFEFTNLKENMGTIMGDLTINATILVKVWEPHLEQYVLIRRPARFPMFGNLLDAYEIDSRLNIDNDLSSAIQESVVKMKKDLNDLGDLITDTFTEQLNEFGDFITDAFDGDSDEE